jgi:hypothetical protein
MDERPAVRGMWIFSIVWLGGWFPSLVPHSLPDSGNPTVGITGGLVETWAMVEAIRAHKAETPKQTSFNLRLRALHFYPDLGEPQLALHP